MRITKHHIKNAAIYLNGIPENSVFRVMSRLDKSSFHQLIRAGFQASATHGSTILPSSIGPTTRLNANGRWIVQRHLPKELRYIRTVYWKWEQFSGNDREEHEGMKDIYRLCYLRDFVAPPSVEVTLTFAGDQICATTPELTKTTGLEDHNIHCVNLMLELFGHCDLVSEDLNSLQMPRIRKANWRMLPPGEYPWEKLERHIQNATSGRSADTQRVIWDRQDAIKSLSPDEIFVGEAGFGDYLAYVFKSRNLVVLESVRKDNAIYAFGLDWKRVSQLSKAEILRDNLQLARIVHTNGWKTNLTGLLTKMSAA